MDSYPRYEATEFGSLVFRMSAEDPVHPSRVTETLGLLYDSHDGTLLKHGNAEHVRPHYKRHREAFRMIGLDPAHLCYLEVPVNQFKGDLLEQINRMLAISGYAIRFNQWLQSQIIQEVPAVVESVR